MKISSMKRPMARGAEILLSGHVQESEKLSMTFVLGINMIVISRQRTGGQAASGTPGTPDPRKPTRGNRPAETENRQLKTDN